MNFIEAVKAMQDGKGVRMPHWRINSHIIKDDSTESGYVICLGDRCHYYQFKELEMLSEDWEIYKKEIRLHTFDEALTALKNGKTIQRQSSISQYHIDKESGRVIGTHDVSMYNGERFLAEAFNEYEAVADDWIIEV